MKKTLLLVFIHGFKGSDNTFGRFPQDLRALVSNALPNIDVQSEQYPRFETRGDLKECVAKFKEWLQNKIIDIEVENKTPSPTVDPSVHVILCGHSMGGIVAAEALLSIAKDDPIPSQSQAGSATNSTSGSEQPSRKKPTKLNTEKEAAPEPSPGDTSALLFPRVQAILAFDTPYLGISPGVLAHGAEEHFNHASAAYKAYGTATQLFGWGGSRSPSPQPIANASAKGLPAPNASGGGGWGKWAMVAGGAAAVAGAAGAAYVNRSYINQGLSWAGSHLEFIGCLARGAELQQRVEGVVKLKETHGVGFANFYGALSEKVTSKTKYAGAVVGEDRTFCVIPKNPQHTGSPTGTKRDAPRSKPPPSKRRKSKTGLEDEMAEGEQVEEFVLDTSKGKGEWIKCINNIASDELKSHTSMFASQKNPDYHAMVPRARDKIVGWIDKAWYESSDAEIESVNDIVERCDEEEAEAEAEAEEEEEESSSAEAGADRNEL